MNAPSQSLDLARAYLGRHVTLRIDRPAGSHHPKHGFAYPVNYGYIPGVPAPDGDDLDAYYLTTTPAEDATGVCVAIIHRLFDDDNKLVVVPDNDAGVDDATIHRLVAFQELPNSYEIVREHAT